MNQSSMTPVQWLAEVQRRIADSEGCKAMRYFDSVGVPTIGIGFNLQRADARQALLDAGVPNVPGTIECIMDGKMALTPSQIDKLFAISFAPIVGEARASLNAGVFDSMTDARRFVICDLVYNLGNTGWLEFETTRSLLNAAQREKNLGNVQTAHEFFMESAAHLQGSAWYGQVGYRAMRDVAMIRSGVWVAADGDGSY